MCCRMEASARGASTVRVNQMENLMSAMCTRARPPGPTSQTESEDLPGVSFRLTREHYTTDQLCLSALVVLGVPPPGAEADLGSDGRVGPGEGPERGLQRGGADLPSERSSEHVEPCGVELNELLERFRE